MAASWEELNAKYGAPASSAPPPAAGGGDPWEALNAKYAAPAQGVAVEVKNPYNGKTYTYIDETGGAPQEQSASKKDVTTVDRARAAAAGINKGVFSDLLGLPVDTVQNVIDLGKVGVGTVMGMAGRPDLMPVVNSDRSGVVGTADWIAKQLNNVGLGGAINNPNPQDTASRVLYSGGRVAGASISPDPRAKISGAQQLSRLAIGELSGLAGGAVGEYAPAYAGLATMAPSVATQGDNSLFKLAMRGGEQGRQQTEQRIQDLSVAGVDNPSAGLATGNRLVQGIENLLSLTPGSIGTIGENRLAALSGLQAKTEGLRDSVSPVYGATEAGAGIQADLRGPLRDRINTTTRTLNDLVEQAVGQNFYTYPQATLDTSSRLSTPNPGAPATSGALVNGRISNIGQNLASDVQGTVIPPNPLMNTPIQYRRADGVVSNTPPGIPFSTLKNLRTSIGEEAGSQAIIGTPEQKQFKQLYGAMSEDMRQAVNAADRQNAGVPVGPLQPSQQTGGNALNRANRFYSTAMDRVEDLNNLANRSTPEGAYDAVAGSLKNGPTTYERVRGAVTPETRQKVVATVIDDLGRATPGQQNADGSAWSPQTFITNYNRLDPQARVALFKRLPGGAQYAEDLATIAKAADMVNQGAKVMANPSGTAAALANRGTLSALTAGAFFYPMGAAMTAAGLGGAAAVSRLLTNPEFVSWLAKAPTVDPNQLQAHAQRLVQAARQSKDAQFQDDVGAYLQSVQQGAKDGN